jgi:hypothetical protein
MVEPLAEATTIDLIGPTCRGWRRSTPCRNTSNTRWPADDRIGPDEIRVGYPCVLAGVAEWQTRRT